MKKVQAKNKRKGLFGLFATLALAIGVGVSVSHKTNLQVRAETLTATLAYPANSGTTNMAAETNYAQTLGLDKDVFSVTAVKNSPNNNVGLNNGGNIRIYTDRNNGNGNDFIISVNEDYEMNKISIVFGASTDSPVATITIDNELIATLTNPKSETKVYNGLNANEIIIKNIQSGGDKNSQIYINSISFEYKLIVASVPVISVTLNKTTETIYTEETLELVATVLPPLATNKNVTWESSDEDVATVTNGVVTGISVGTTTITVKTVDGNFTADCIVTVIQNPLVIDKFSVKGFAGSTTSSYASAVGDYLDTVGSEETQLALRVFLGNNGAMRGNQDGIENNFSMRNVDMYPGYIRKIVLNGTGGTFNETSSETRNLVNLGNVAYDLNNATEGEKVEAVYTVNGSVHTLTWTIPEEVNARYFIMHNLHAGGTMVAAATDAVQIFYEPVSSVVSALSADKSSKSYFTTDVLEESDFIVSVTMDGAPGTSGAYSAKIGTGKGAAFAGTDIVWGTTKPRVEDKTIQFKAKYPQTHGGSDYLFFDVDLTITEPEVEIIVISGDLTKKSYFTTDSWNPNGLTVTAIYENDAEVDVTNDSGLSWSFDPIKPNDVSITSVEVTATFSGETETREITGISVSQKPPIVISEIYGAGGNSGAVLKQDFIELYNNGEGEVDLTGWTIWYASSAGSFTKGTSAYKTLTGKIAAKSYYLIQLAGGTNGDDLPYYDELGTINMGATNFKVALTNDFEIPTGSTGSNVIDFVGGGTANDYEGEGSAKGASATKSISRTIDEGLMVDTDDNAADFTSSDPSPITGHHGAAERFAAFLMSYAGGDLVTEQCTAKFAAALIEWNKLSGSAKSIFKTDDAYKGSEGALSRFTHWALVNGYSSLDAVDSLPDGVKADNSKESPITATIIIGVIGLTTLSGYYFLKKKKEA